MSQLDEKRETMVAESATASDANLQKHDYIIYYLLFTIYSISTHDFKISLSTDFMICTFLLESHTV